MYAYGYFNSFKPSLGGVSFDADALAFISAAGITDPTQQSAVNQLVVDLKAASIWTKMKAVYPFVGGTASTHKWNLKDPRDLNAAFRLVFNGGMTHSSNGITGNGTNAYADTNLIPLNTLSQDSTHFSVYSRTNSTGGNECIIGSATTAFSSNGDFLIAFSDSAYVQVNNSSFLTGTLSDSRRLLLMNRNSSSTVKMWRDNVSVINTSSTSTGLSNGRILLNAFLENNTSISRYAVHNIAFASIGDGLSDADATALNNAVVTFQTTLSRNV